MERLREVQRAHKSDKITVAQAKNAWLKVERERAKSISRAAGKDGIIKKDTAASTSQGPGTGEGAKRAKRGSTNTKNG